MISLYSFDIFDTLITRVTANPRGIFDIINHIIQCNKKFDDITRDFKVNYLTLRSNAESYIHKHRMQDGDEETTLDEIYATICSNYRLSDQQKEQLISLEIDVELACSVGIQKNISYVKELINQGKRVILISDMYLPIDAIRNMLIAQDIVFSDIPIYVSSEIRLRKSTGHLYSYIQNRENILYNEWEHIGDNVKSDVIIPRRMGIKTRQYNYPSFTRAELSILNENISSPEAQISVGIGRNFRLNPDSYSIQEDLGLSYLGLLLYSYTAWVIHTARKNSISELYFMARDGYILQKICENILSEFGWDNIKTYYLYGSRASLRFDSAECNNEGNDVENRKKRAKKYLQQALKNISSPESFALVDSKGSGKTMDSVANLLNISPDRLQAFYFRDISNSPDVSCRKYTYMLNINSLGDTIEFFVRALHGQTNDYSEVNGVMVPVFEKEDEAIFLKQWGYEKYIDGVLRFSNEFAYYSHKFKLSDSSLTLSISYLKQLQSPRRKVLKTIVSIPFYDMASKYLYTAAPAMTLCGLIVDYLIHKHITKTYCINYSLLLGDPIVIIINVLLSIRGHTFSDILDLIIDHLKK